MRWLLGLFVAGCYNPAPKAGAPCSVTSECPAPLVCEMGVCQGMNEGLSDASIEDAAPADDAMLPVDPALVPSNGVDPELALSLTVPIVVDGIATFNVDTGRIIGAVVRQQGDGVRGDIGYEQRMFENARLAVFSFHSLTVTENGRVQFVGARPVVFVVGNDVLVAGRIDLAGCSAGACPGPGGGAGSLYTSSGGGCGGGMIGGGRAGATDLASEGDSGGGGGGGGTDGARGGNDVENPALVLPGGAGGMACIPETLEPLVGGGGGAGGGPGTATGTRGGSGGGALQISAFGSILVSGIIDASGGGGAAGQIGVDGSNAGAGAGGGAGGAILLEAPSVTVTGIVVANGGGGGGASNGVASGQPGARGQHSTLPAPGGASGNGNGDGGAGGSRLAPPQRGEDVMDNNGGGGGGAAGRIRFRGNSLVITGTTSPAPSAVSL